MTIALDPSDRDQLTNMLIDTDVLVPQSRALDFVNKMLQYSPRQRDLKRQIDVSKPPGLLAEALVHRLADVFGQDMPGRESLVLLIDALKPEVGSPQQDFLDGLVRKYHMQHAIAPSDIDHLYGGGDLEKVIRQNNSFLDVAVWLDRLTAITKQVCRVETPSGYGTGFLVGPDVLLTNYHVVEEVILGKHTPDQVKLCFDYAVPATSGLPAQCGQILGLHQPNWLIDYSEFDEADLQPEPKTWPVNPDKLDYALLRIAGRPGETRGWVRQVNAKHPFVRDSALFIAQHPQGAPMKLALDTRAIVKTLPGRVRYRTNTEPGSSGSPCFDQNWDLVALHHLGEPVPNAVQPKWNEGLPMAAIVAQMQTKGTLGETGLQMQ